MPKSCSDLDTVPTQQQLDNRFQIFCEDEISSMLPFLSVGSTQAMATAFLRTAYDQKT